MTTSTLFRPAHAGNPSPPVIERLLREREEIWQQVSEAHDLPRLIGSMLGASLICLATCGVVIGLSHSLTQALVSAVKLPLLYLLTLAICLPTLYFFNLLGGGRLSLRQVMALALSAITIPAVLTLAFTPVTLFILVTAQSYPFYVLLNVTLLALTSVIGVGFFLGGARSLNRRTVSPRGDTPDDHAINPSLAGWWLLLYAIVGTQLSASLSPFFGDPALPFVLFQPPSNFIVALVEQLLRL